MTPSKHLRGSLALVLMFANGGCLYDKFSNENTPTQLEDSGIAESDGPTSTELDSGTGDTEIKDGATDSGNDSSYPTDASESGSNAEKCTTASDCPIPSSECIEPACVDGKCETHAVEPGTELSQQIRGDCKIRLCGLTGNVAIFTDDSDVPVDDNPCTNDICLFGEPSNPPIAAGSACPSGRVCDGAGSCVECTVNTHCALPTECQNYECRNHECVAVNVANGTPIINQVAGDCHQNVCDGAGDWMNRVDNSNVPNDDNPCTNDVCNDGVPTHTNVSGGTVCGAGVSCDGSGSCTGCVNASQCPGTDTFCGTKTCVAGKCGFSYQPKGTALEPAQQTPGSCEKKQCNGSGSVETVADDTNSPPDTECTIGVCNAGIPAQTNKSTGISCTSNKMCNGSGTCVECIVANDCDGVDTFCAVRTCSPVGICGMIYTPSGTALEASMQTDGDCQRKQCDGSGKEESVPDDTDLPPSGECYETTCTNGVLKKTNRPSGTPCPSGNKCDGAGTCVGCKTASECVVGADSFCATRSCSSTGQCGIDYTPAGTPLNAAEQVDADCQRKQCNGTGSVETVFDESDTPLSGLCKAGVCTDGIPAYEYAAQNTPCGTDRVCNNAGLCPLPPSSSVFLLSDGGNHTCASRGDGVLHCWGDNSQGQLGDGTTTEQHLNPVPVLSAVTGVSAGQDHTCAIIEDEGGSLLCWGWNDGGQLGDGTTTGKLVPTPVSSLASNIIAVSAGERHTCAIRGNGELLCWGDNSQGQLGDGTVTDRPVPTPVSVPASDIVAVSTGPWHTCAIRENGELLCWGHNSYGQLGTGTATYYPNPIPTPVPGLTSGVTAVSAGVSHACAIKEDRELLCWGGNSAGALGDGTTTDRFVPTPVSGLASGVAAVSTGAHTCAIKEDNGLLCWGNNYFGQLGIGSYEMTPLPTAVSMLGTGVIHVSLGSVRTSAFVDGDVLYWWGRYNYLTELGSHSPTAPTPQVIVGFP